LIGQRVSHYRILKKIGQGGMGEVYLAEDTSLKRPVALKFLPQDQNQDEVARKRLIREAESAAALDHPFICKIYETGRTETNQQFIAMEFVEGRTLKDRLSDGPLFVGEALRIASQIGDALDLAHQKGIVHRDLKPANIMLTPQGHAKVMDFGLAKRFRNQGQEVTVTLTQQGAAVGTLAYMSPEQLQGKTLDTRSDIFSFGVVLYQMLTGVHPFRKEESIQTITAILYEDPPPLSAHLRGLPESLSKSLGKMLAKDPRERFQSATEIRTALTDTIASGLAKPRRSLGFWGSSGLAAALVVAVAMLGVWRLRESPSPSAPIVNSIAVLPLENLSGDPEQEYFVDGMTDALITDLCKIRALKVIARSSAMRYKGTEKPLSEIARELGVEAVVEGSVLREGSRVRINAQLVDANTDRNLWADRYESEMTSILGLQSEVARAIARQIQVTLTPAEQALLTRARQVNPEAYEAYLKGRFHANRLASSDLETGMQYYESALKIEPEYALAYAGIAFAWAAMQQMGQVSPTEARPKATAAAFKAFELDDTLAQTNHAMAAIKMWVQWDWEGAEKSFRRTIELDPNYVDVRPGYAHYLMIMQRPDEAMAQMKYVLELDPLNFRSIAFYGSVLCYGERRYGEAIEQFQSVLKTVPNHPMALSNLVGAFALKGMYVEAFEAATKCATLLGVPGEVEALQRGYAGGGFAQAMKRWADRLALSSNTGRVSPYRIAVTFALAGENDRALHWLERGFEAHDPNMPYIGVDPNFDVLRHEVRYRNLLRRLNFPEGVIARTLNLPE